jgi:hypothetical protein
MNNYHTLSEQQKRLVLRNAEEYVHLPAVVIEKDLWVTTILQILFDLDLDANILFKGGTSLSKIGNLIERFSEDIDIAIDPAKYGMSGDLTKKQLKNLRKRSSLYVRNTLAPTLQEGLDKYGLTQTLTLEVEPDGEGDSTYPEPRRIFVKYPSLLEERYGYLKNEVVLEVGARSLMEPTIACHITSMIESSLPTISTSLVNPEIVTAAPAKTFVEKACLLHELFSIERDTIVANRRSRHLYDLERMMDLDFAMKAMADHDLWQSVQHHRSVFTSMQNIDYSVDFRKTIVLCPPDKFLADWKEDYRQMCETMIFGNKLSFEKLIDRIRELENRFHSIG